MKFVTRMAVWLGLSLAALAAAPARAAEEVVVAQIAPLSGVLATTGAQMVLGGKVYFDAVNERGGVHGAKIKHLVFDDGYKIDETVRITKELTAKPEVVALFGLAGTANVGKLLSDRILERGGMPLVAPYTGGEPLRTPFNPWIFHVRAGYVDEAEQMVRQLTTLGITRVAILYQDDAFGQSGRDGVQAALQRRGHELVAQATYDRLKPEVDGAVQKILVAQAQAVIMIAVNKPAALFVKKYRQAGGGGQLFNISVVDPAELVKFGGIDNVRGLGISQVVPYPYQPSLPVVREFHEAMKKYAPDQAVNYTNFEEFLGAKVLVEGLRRAGPKPTRKKLLDALASLIDHDLGGIRVSYGSSNRVGSRYVEVTVIGGDGKLRK